MLFNKYEELVGNTPLYKLNNIMKDLNLENNIYAKLEYFNPAGSVKDRVAVNMINAAIKDGTINNDTIIIEPTSGNTGIGLAAYCASLRMKVIIVMPSNMSEERIKMIEAYGAEIILTDSSLGMKGAVNKALELHELYKNSYIPSQFDNMNNPKAHIKTGKEIYDDLNGSVDIFISAIGTGGTISGVGKYLKERNPNIKIIGVEPESSPLLSKGYTGPHKIQGIGPNFIPNTLNRDIYDEIIDVSNEDAFNMMKVIAKSEGIGVGISSGAALVAVIKVSKEYKGKNIVVLFPDGINRYMSLLQK